MSLFAKKLPLGIPMRSDVQIVSMKFSGTKPKPGDVLKLTNEGKVEVTTTNTDAAYGIAGLYDNHDVCAVVTHGHVLAKLTNPTVGSRLFGILDVVRKVEASDEAGTQISDAYEVRVG